MALGGQVEPLLGYRRHAQGIVVFTERSNPASEVIFAPWNSSFNFRLKPTRNGTFSASPTANLRSCPRQQPFRPLYMGFSVLIMPRASVTNLENVGSKQGPGTSHPLTGDYQNR